MSLDIFTLSENENDKVKTRDKIGLILTNGLPLIIKPSTQIDLIGDP